MNWVLLLSLLLELLLSANAFESISPSGSLMALGSAILDSSKSEIDIQRVVLSGIDLNSFSCYASIGGNFQDTLEQETVIIMREPDMMCLRLSRLPSRQNELPNLVIMAMNEQEQQASVLELDSKVSSNLSLSIVTDLPKGNFPAVVATDEQGGIYMALHQTNEKGISQSTTDRFMSAWSYQRQFAYPNHNVAPMFSPVVYKYNSSLKEERWKSLFNTTSGKTFITGLAPVRSRDKLVVVGSTTGHGMSIGAMAKSNGDWDGFITLVNLDTGVIDTSSFATPNHNHFSKRIASQFDKDDMVLGLCMADDKVYVVGWTEGKIEGETSGGAFVLKFDIDTVDIIWKRQVVGVRVEATYCDVLDDVVYVGGQVPPNVRLEENDPFSSPTTTVDLFVASFHSKTGELAYIRQIDSLRHDYMIGLEIGPNKDVYVTANAYDEEQGTVHAYVLSVDSEGNHDWQGHMALGRDPITGKQTKKETIDPFTVAAIVVPVVLFLAMIVYWTFCYRSGKKSTKEPKDRLPEEEGAYPQPSPRLIV